MLQIAGALSAGDISTVRTLLREYQALLGVDLGFQGFEAELLGLPGAYAPPTGCLLLATYGGQPVGCVALRASGPSQSEMKRLYVRPTARGLGVGRALVSQILREASAIGYAEIVLDTLPGMIEAQHLYAQFGFHEVPPYRPNPIQGTRYLAKSLLGA